MDRSGKLDRKEMEAIQKSLGVPIFKKEIIKEKAIEQKKLNIEGIFIKNKSKPKSSLSHKKK
jgi:hypothetical protein